MTICSNYIYFHVLATKLFHSQWLCLAYRNWCRWFLLIGYVFFKLASHMSVNMSYHEFDQSLDMVSIWLLAEFSDFMYYIEARITNRFLSAEPEVSGLAPFSGQSPPLLLPVCTDVPPISFRVPQEDQCL